MQSPLPSDYPEADKAIAAAQATKDNAARAMLDALTSFVFLTRDGPVLERDAVVTQARDAITQAKTAGIIGAHVVAQSPGPVAHGMEDGKVYAARVKSTGAEILGTYETVTARAEIAYFMAAEGFDGSGVGYEHAGGSEVFWDGMETVTRPNGRIVYLCENGDEWTADQLDFVEAD